MPRLVMGAWALGAALAALGAAAVVIDARGYDRGHAAATAAATAAQDRLEQRLAARGADLAAALDQLAAAREARAADTERLEHEATDAPGADRPALPADSLRRLSRRWGAPG